MKKTLTLLVLFALGGSWSFGQRYSHLLFEFDTKDTVELVSNQGKKPYYRNLLVYSTGTDSWHDTATTNKLDFPVEEHPNVKGRWVISIDKSHEDQFIYIADTGLSIQLKKDSVYELLELNWRVNSRVRDYQRFMVVEKFDTTSRGFVKDTVDLKDKNNYCFCGTKYDGRILGLIEGIKPYDITSDAYIYSTSQILTDSIVRVITDSMRAQTIVNDSTHQTDFTWDVHPRLNTVFSNPNTDPYNTDTHYIDIFPARTATKRVGITLSAYGGVFLQPHTELRGAFFDSTQQIRHKLILSLDSSGEMCIPEIVELVMRDDNQLRFDGGNVALHGQRSCVMIRDNAEMIIGAKHSLQYGKNGVGILALKPGTTVAFEEDSRLTINNTLALTDYSNTLDGGAIDIELFSGNELVFGPDAKVSNGPFAFGSVTLNIHLKGGIVDLSQLDDQSLELINVINYLVPSTPAPPSVFPNPSTDKIHLTYDTDSALLDEISIYDVKGNIITNFRRKEGPGATWVPVDISTYRPGVYYVRIETIEGAYTLPFVVL